MSRTHKTAPYNIRGYRSQGRKPPRNWREIAKNTDWLYPWYDEAAWNETRPCPPHWKASYYGERSGTKIDRRFSHHKIRASQREAISHWDVERRGVEQITRYTTTWWD